MYRTGIIDLESSHSNNGGELFQGIFLITQRTNLGRKSLDIDNSKWKNDS